MKNAELVLTESKGRQIDLKGRYGIKGKKKMRKKKIREVKMRGEGKKK